MRERHISPHGWQRYLDFAKSTCRLDDDTYAKIHFSDPEYVYWNWEEAEFIKALRLTLIPETQTGDYSAIVKENRLDAIDRRLLAAELPSLCTSDNKSHEDILSENDKTIQEHNAFEDVLINTIFDGKVL
uniref:Uncharacterized protein n=1 Tax=Plectus sambesii TaxID=2011161 RepID=A0A914VVN3_9BILA